MSKANVDLVKGLYAAFINGDIETIVAALTSNVSWIVNGRRQDHPLFGERGGPEGVIEFFRTLGEIQVATEFSPREFYDFGDKVIVFGRYAWNYRKSGGNAAAEFAHIFTVRSGRVRSFVEFTDTAQFVEAYRGAGVVHSTRQGVGT